MTKKPNKYLNKVSKLRLNGKTVRSADFKLHFGNNERPTWTAELSTEKLRNLVKEFVAAKGNYSPDQIQFLNELKNELHPPVYRAAFLAKGLI
tara:strand:+ start:203 stop:481 length:279 start_codon:yes stop_codon:yes gene_type:complete